MQSYQKELFDYMGFLSNFGLKEFIFQKQKCQLVVCVNSDASLCTSVFYIGGSCGHAKIRDTF